MKKNRTKQQATRFIILPVKKHLAKFLLFDKWDKLNHPQNGIISILNMGNNNSIFWKDSLVRYWLCQILNESIKNENWFISARYYRNGKTINQFTSDKYSFLKIKVKVTATPHMNSSKYNYQKVIKTINGIANKKFKAFCFTYIEYHPKKTKAIDEIFTIFKLNENDLKKQTMKRAYYRA